MKLSPVSLALCTLAIASPASAHITSGALPHWHAGDAVGILVVVALTGLAAWIDRRGR